LDGSRFEGKPTRERGRLQMLRDLTKGDRWLCHTQVSTEYRKRLGYSGMMSRACCTAEDKRRCLILKITTASHINEHDSVTPSITLLSTFHNHQDTLVVSLPRVNVLTMLPLKFWCCLHLRYNLNYCKTLIFHCIVISRFWSVENLRHYNFSFLFLTAFCWSIFSQTSVAASTVCKMITCTVYENVEVEC